VRVGDHRQIHRDLGRIRIFVGRRAVQLLPGSYKLWRNHLLFQIKHGIPYTIVTASFEDCFKRLHKMPRLWIDYLEYVQRPENFVDITYWRSSRESSPHEFTSHPTCQGMGCHRASRRSAFGILIINTSSSVLLAYTTTL
jgi:hypothetical protein